MTARLTLRTHRGDRLEYVRRARADAAGAWELRVAYPTEAVGEVRAEGTYAVDLGGTRVNLEVPEHAVHAGASIPADPVAHDDVP